MLNNYRQFIITCYGRPGFIQLRQVKFMSTHCATDLSITQYIGANNS